MNVLWDDEEITHIHLNRSAEEALEEIPNWQSHAALEFVENGDALLGIASRNPDAFADVDPGRVSKFRTADLKKWEKFDDFIMRDAVNWSAVSSPTKEWALKIFPDCTSEQAVERLWEAIFQTCRVDQPDPVAAWESHIIDLKKRCSWLNTMREIQAIGGVNLKIEGFFDVCSARGLTGTQGVLIPETNVADLMLREDVLEAVRKNRFHVYAISTIDEGIEILTGHKAGHRRADGAFEQGTVFALVDQKLCGFAEQWKKFEAGNN